MAKKSKQSKIKSQVNTEESNVKPSESFKAYMTRWLTVDLLKFPGQVYDATVGKVGVSLLGLVKKVGLAISSGDSGSGDRDFTPPDFDLTQVQKAYERDGYVRAAVDKYVDLILKPGYDIVSKNTNATDYINLRFAYMEEVSGVPKDVLIGEIAQSVVMFNNAFIGKARAADKNALPPGNAVKGMDGMDPIGAYFVLNSTTMQIKRDKNGVVKAWQQQAPGQDKPAKFKPQDIVHMYYKREPGMAFAYPSILAVIDDVRALREVEERTLHMLYRNIHPLFHVKVGTKEIPGQVEEVELIKGEVQNMSVEGGLVSTERISIDSVASDKIIDADKYLVYFEKRVFTGLGVSETMMGRGDTSNRSTSDNQKEEAVDRVKAIQKVINVFITYGMINELLREGGFDPLNNPDDKVLFQLKDPDADSKIKGEAHAVFLYQNNSITEGEMRVMLGRDPIPDGDRATLWFPQYGLNTDGAASNKTMPANQSGKKTSPKKTTNGFRMQTSEYMNDLRNGLMKNADSLFIQVPNKVAHIRNTISDTQRLVVYWQTMVEKTVKEYYGEEQLVGIKNNIGQVFRNIYDTTIDIMAEIDTKSIATETISAIFDVFIEELVILTNSLREGE